MKHVAIIFTLFLTFCGHCLYAGQTRKISLEIKSGLDKNHYLNSDWLNIVYDRHSQAETIRLQNSTAPLSEAEKQWQNLITIKRTMLESSFQEISFLVDDALRPETVYIVFANRGGNDAFTWGKNTIGIDLSHWVKAYGRADTQGNEERMYRIFRHEFTHLLTRAYRANLSKKWDRNPWERAIWTIYHEGLGTYWSLSTKWVSKEGKLTSKANQALKTLEPILKERLLKLYHDNGSSEFALRSGISGGNFSKRWGALTVALWLAQEIGGSADEFSRWLKKGPEGIVQLIDMRLRIKKFEMR